MLRIVGGGPPTAEELAAVIAALTSRAQAAPAAAKRSRWNDRGGALRRPLSHGPGAWQASARAAGLHSA